MDLLLTIKKTRPVHFYCCSSLCQALMKTLSQGRRQSEQRELDIPFYKFQLSVWALKGRFFPRAQNALAVALVIPAAFEHLSILSKCVHKCGRWSPEEVVLALSAAPADHKSSSGQAGRSETVGRWFMDARSLWSSSYNKTEHAGILSALCWWCGSTLKTFHENIIRSTLLTACVAAQAQTASS